MTAETGAQAPDFSAPATGDKTLSLSDFAGRTLVLYFYPRDNTPGCTQEGEAFRDAYDDFRAAGADIVGVSRDSLRKHENFRRKYDFPFDLVSDPDEKLCRAYDVLKEKNMYGRRHIGIERSTFVIDGDGVIRHVWRGVKVADHAQEVLDAVRALAA
ncbi:peroxiredoxin [Salinisphaera orenii]|uniref:thioredoxin-dependent peroxiredoxin n=1 Tax=Salinisphaera orenii YIM 95161 TaxID=1051139 RepID=A0A423Q1V8_9GAMM|nr:peroxiredoxin [Salinisphaera halophila]ROO32399.1 peroxiredoxin [Salinisphaera halophila YIM 95161]